MLWPPGRIARKYGAVPPETVKLAGSQVTRLDGVVLVGPLPVAPPAPPPPAELWAVMRWKRAAVARAARAALKRCILSLRVSVREGSLGELSVQMCKRLRLMV